MNSSIILILCILALSLGLLIFALGQRKNRKKEGNTEEISPKSATSKALDPEVASVSSPMESEKPSISAWQSALQKSREPFLLRWKDALQSLATGESWGENHPLWNALEESLLGSDLGPKMTEELLGLLKQDFRQTPSESELKTRLKERMTHVLENVKEKALPEAKPFVTLLIGVNGAGKTTTAGKLAAQAKGQGKKVILGAGDTFRAAAVDQLKTWADRIGVECITPAQGANPAAVAFDAVAAGLARGADEVIIDTAGRLHTKDNLMEELKKVVRVVEKKIPGAPHRVLLVLDATLGQNAVVQAREFGQSVPATGVVLTKMDGSSRGGAAFTVAAELGVPVAYVGLGENAEDLKTFSAHEFVDNLLP